MLVEIITLSLIKEDYLFGMIYLDSDRMEQFTKLQAYLIKKIYKNV